MSRHLHRPKRAIHFRFDFHFGVARRELFAQDIGKAVACDHRCSQ
jgi:hypothetical protein